MNLEAWKSLGRRQILAAPPWLDVYQEAVELPSGRRLDDFFRVVMPEFVVVVTLSADGQHVLVRGYKHGLGRVTLSPPAGVIEPGEEPLAAAQRELREETGFTAEEWHFLGKHIVDGNRQCGTMHSFVARGARRTTVPVQSDAEELHVELLSRAGVLRALRNGEVGTLAGAAALAFALALDEC